MKKVRILSAFWPVALACFGLVSPAVLSAQTPARVDEGFRTLAPPGAAVEVVGPTGNRTRGRLLRLDAESFTIRSGGREVRFDRPQVAEVYQRGDSLKSGLLTGLGLGAGLGFVAGLANDSCGALFSPRKCTGSERARIAAVAGGLLGAVGMGIGVGLDALFTGRRLVYYREDAAVAAIRLAPVVNHSGAGVVVAATW